MRIHVTIEFDDLEKARAYADEVRRAGTVRWDRYDDRAYAYVDVVSVAKIAEENDGHPSTL